jgi:photosystem II stability/assembly factor-like uncharacterized protein
MVNAPARRPLMAVASAGEHLVAVGSRGLVIVSQDQGQTWKQAKVPVQSDLLAAHFPTANTGWAVGHDGVVLRSDDGGNSWSKQLDGRIAAGTFRKHYEARVQQGDASAKRALEQLELNFKAGATLPYLDVWFKDTNVGYAVGSFGMLIMTTDGGKTWLPWLDRIDNDQLNLNSVRGLGGEVFIVGEKGRVYKLDRSRERFVMVDTGYAGSFFGLAGSDNVMLAYGLRGVAYRSENQGRTWEPLRMPSEVTIAAGVFDPKTSSFVLVNSAGQMLTGDATARQFAAVKVHRPMRLTGVLALPNKGSVVTTGFAGIALETLPAALAK